LVGGFFAVKFSKFSYILSSFAAGAVLALAFFDLIPESIENSNIHNSMNYIAIGFAVYFLINNWLSFSENKECKNKFHNANALGLCAHSVGDGLAIGLILKSNPTLAIPLIIALIFHDLADGMNVATISKTHKIRWIIADALAPFMGYFISLFFIPSHIMMGNVLGIIGGVFVYMSTIHLIPECHKSNNKLTTCAAFLIGIILMRLIN